MAKISAVIEDLKAEKAIEKDKSQEVIQLVSVKTVKLDQKKELLKRVENDGFKVNDFITGRKASCYCAGCKKEKELSSVFYGTYKSGLSFVRGTCKTCGAECWKTLKE